MRKPPSCLPVQPATPAAPDGLQAVEPIEASVLVLFRSDWRDAPAALPLPPYHWRLARLPPGGPLPYLRQDGDRRPPHVPAGLRRRPGARPRGQADLPDVRREACARLSLCRPYPIIQGWPGGRMGDRASAPADGAELGAGHLQKRFSTRDKSSAAPTGPASERPSPNETTCYTLLSAVMTAPQIARETSEQTRKRKAQPESEVFG